MPPKREGVRGQPPTQLQDLSSKNRLLARDLNSTRSKSKNLQRSNSVLSSRVLKLESVVRGLTQQTAELQKMLRESRREGMIWKEEMRGQEAAIRELSEALAKAHQHPSPLQHQQHHQPLSQNPNNVTNNTNNTTTNTLASASDSFLSGLSSLSIDAAPYSPYSSSFSSPVSPPPGLGQGLHASPTAELRRTHRLQAQERSSSTSPPALPPPPPPPIPQLPIGTPPFAPPAESTSSPTELEHSPPLQFSPVQQQQQKRPCRRRRSIGRPVSYAEPNTTAKLRQGHVFFPLDDENQSPTDANRLDFGSDEENDDALWQEVKSR
ncbi:hypothetical protein TrLO_g5499 [Triparma laevis f. longispina]|uniref:Uncharacterized protein n=1 Tax=Triparma laevis f. longispina TaxID=1714387 RepID=A0A9W7KU46_9STRA|nr:hypothetical protein TrLO_g5499 [Triparma laevis f. longispina]